VPDHSRSGILAQERAGVIRNPRNPVGASKSRDGATASSPPSSPHHRRNKSQHDDENKVHRFVRIGSSESSIRRLDVNKNVKKSPGGARAVPSNRQGIELLLTILTNVGVVVTKKYPTYKNIIVAVSFLICFCAGAATTCCCCCSEDSFDDDDRSAF